MSQTLTYVIGQDRRPHVDNVQDFKVNFDGSNTNWVQARQYERSMRQVFVNIKNEDGTPLDLTGCNVWFEGLLPKNSASDFRVIDDKGYVALDPTAGRFRFDMPGHAFTVAGSYRQAFFRILKDGNSITILEFDLDVLADKVIDGLVPRTYISPVEELINEIEAKYQDSTDKLTKMTSDFVDKFTQSMNTLKALSVTVQNGLDALEQKIKQDGLFTQAEADAFKQAIMKAISLSYSTVSDMKQANLKARQYAETKGYYLANDGGGASYLIMSAQPENKHYELLSNGMYASLIADDYVNLKQLGAKEDSNVDLAPIINTNTALYDLFLPAGSYYANSTIKPLKSIKGAGGGRLPASKIISQLGSGELVDGSKLVTESSIEGIDFIANDEDITVSIPITEYKNLTIRNIDIESVANKALKIDDTFGTSRAC